MVSGVEGDQMRASGRGVHGTRTAIMMLAGIIVSVGALWTRPAHADFRVCNATQNLVGVAIGYRASTGWISEGWWHIEGSACKTLIEGSLQSRYYYLFAEDAERGGRWEGAINMCVADKEFKIAGVNDCYARGFERAGFEEYDTGEQENWMVQLTESRQPDASDGIGGSEDPSASPEPEPVVPPADENATPDASNSNGETGTDSE